MKDSYKLAYEKQLGRNIQAEFLLTMNQKQLQERETCFTTQCNLHIIIVVDMISQLQKLGKKKHIRNNDYDIQQNMEDSDHVDNIVWGKRKKTSLNQADVSMPNGIQQI